MFKLKANSQNKLVNTRNWMYGSCSKSIGPLALLTLLKYIKYSCLLQIVFELLCACVITLWLTCLVYSSAWNVSLAVTPQHIDFHQ